MNRHIPAFCLGAFRQKGQVVIGENGLDVDCRVIDAA